MIIMIIITNTVLIWFHESLGFWIMPACREAPSRGTTWQWVCWREVGGVVRKRLRVGCPCTPVSNEIVTPRHLLISKSRCQYFESFINVFLQHFSLSFWLAWPALCTAGLPCFPLSLLLPVFNKRVCLLLWVAFCHAYSVKKLFRSSIILYVNRVCLITGPCPGWWMFFINTWGPWHWLWYFGLLISNIIILRLRLRTSTWMINSPCRPFWWFFFSWFFPLMTLSRLWNRPRLFCK